MNPINGRYIGLIFVLNLNYLTLTQCRIDDRRRRTRRTIRRTQRGRGSRCRVIRRQRSRVMMMIMILILCCRFLHSSLSIHQKTTTTTKFSLYSDIITILWHTVPIYQRFVFVHGSLYIYIFIRSNDDE